MPLVAERNHTQKRGWWLLFRRFWSDFWRSLGGFCSFGGCCWETHRIFLVFRPRELLGAAGTKIVRPWLLGGRFCSSLWPSLGQVASAGQPPHRRGRVSPDKRVLPLPWRWSHPTPNPPTWVGWVPGGRWGKAEHTGGVFFFCPPLGPGFPFGFLMMMNYTFLKTRPRRAIWQAPTAHPEN